MYDSNMGSPMRFTSCVTKPTCTMKRLIGPLAIFLTLPFLLGSHAPADVSPESGNAAGAGYCPSATVQIHTGSGYVVRTSDTGVVGACTHFQVGFSAPVGGPNPTHFYVYEVQYNGSRKEIARATCIYRGCSGGSRINTVAPTSRIVIIGIKYSGGIGGGVAELDTAPW